jgi:hypothetical protein
VENGVPLLETPFPHLVSSDCVAAGDRFFTRRSLGVGGLELKPSSLQRLAGLVKTVPFLETLFLYLVC